MNSLINRNISIPAKLTSMSSKANCACSESEIMDIYHEYEYQIMYPFCPCSKCYRDEMLESPFDDHEVERKKASEDRNMFENVVVFWRSW